MTTSRTSPTAAAARQRNRQASRAHPAHRASQTHLAVGQAADRLMAAVAATLRTEVEMAAVRDRLMEVRAAAEAVTLARQDRATAIPHPSITTERNEP